MQGLRGSTGLLFAFFGVLPEIQDRPLSEVPSLVRDNRPPSTAQSNEIHDVFISHASEDKDDFVRSLANSLISHGLNVWYDEMTLRIGDSLRQKNRQRFSKQSCWVSSFVSGVYKQRLDKL
ncbi:toll/interleukin-1 receptor domain-containing protein [Klebsiella quasipneumoniae]|uniref:toll/interleukin-1 receptor domain-containing protein n=1 Tax=Klebsiella quasipneumoniae TaxID=1463165 RepID=UPI003890F106